MSRELQQRLEEAIDELPEPRKEVLVRARLLQLDHATIAGELGISTGSSRQLLHRAIARLSILLEQEN